MDNGNPELQQQKNSDLSLALIGVNIILAAVLYHSIASSNDAKMLLLPVVIWTATFLVGIYVFTYPGKGHRMAKWIFGILLVVSMILIGLTLYIIALAGAYKN